MTYDDKPIVHLISETPEEGIELAISATAANDKDVLGYQWHKKNGTEWNAIGTNSSINIVTSPSENIDDFEDVYSVSISTTRNNATCIKENVVTYRLTNAPAAPVFVTEGSTDYSISYTRNVHSKINTNNGRYKDIGIRASLNGARSDVAEPIYLWFFREAISGQDLDTIVLEPDADGVLNIGDIPNNPHDIILNNTVADFNETGDKIIFTGDLTDSSNTYQFTPDSKDGFYYCVAINKLNENYTAAVCPYNFLVG